MNFDVSQIIEDLDHDMDVLPVSEEVKEPPVVEKKPEPKEEKELSPVELLQRKNDAYEGARVNHHKKGPHVLKNSADQDMEEIMKEMPNTMSDIAQWGNRVAQIKAKLNLGEGGFVDQEIEDYNFRTGKTTGEKHWATSQQINAEFIAREPTMSDEDLEDFLRSYFVEFDTKTGEVKPRKYPPKPGFQCSVTFPSVAVNGVTPTTPQDARVGAIYHQESVKDNNPPEEKEEGKDSNTPAKEMKKITFRIEERNVGVRKKIDRKKLPALSEMILDRNSVPVTAVASRYKCDITAVTYEEYDQIRSMVETSSLAKEMKMWSMVYRHVKNPTIGEFKSFEDFCEHTAWVDRQRFWFALMCSMTMDKDTNTITCHNNVYKRINGYEKLDLSSYKEAYKEIEDVSNLPTMKMEIEDMNVYSIIVIGDKHFKYVPMPLEDNPDVVRWTAVEQEGSCDTVYPMEYYNRSLIDTKNLEKWVSEEIEKINTISDLQQAIEFHEEGALIKKRIVQLNDMVSVEVGFKSVSDILKKDYRYVVPEELNATAREICKNDIVEKKGDPAYEPSDEEADNYFQNEMSYSTLVALIMCQIVDKVIIADEEGESESDDPATIVDIIRQCSPADVAILYNDNDNNHLLHRYASSYEPTFSYKNCKCPSCGYTTDIPILKVEDLVFTLSRSLTNTTFDIASL